MTEDNDYDEEIAQITERVRELQDRVAYLEREVGTSAKEQRFKNGVERIFSDGEVLEVETDDALEWTAKGKVPADYTRHTIQNIEKHDDYEWWVVDTDEDDVVMRIEMRVQ